MWALVLMSVGPICLYVVIWLGWIKSWYILVPLPGRFNSSAVYALLPWGLAFTMLLIGAEFFPVANRTELDIWSVSFFLFGGIGLLFIIWCPSWFKPSWVRWLEREYGYGLDILVEEARKMGRWNWEARVRTREGLVGWVHEVLERRREDMYWAFRDWLNYYIVRNMLRMKRKCPEKLNTIERYMLPARVHIPRHREKDYESHLEVERTRISQRRRKEEREQKKEQKVVVRAAIEAYNTEELFTISDLEHTCPDVSRAIIRQVLNNLRNKGHVECSGQGRAARWRRKGQKS